MHASRTIARFEIQHFLCSLYHVRCKGNCKKYLVYFNMIRPYMYVCKFLFFDDMYYIKCFDRKLILKFPKIYMYITISITNYFLLLILSILIFGVTNTISINSKNSFTFWQTRGIINFANTLFASSFSEIRNKQNLNIFLIDRFYSTFLLLLRNLAIRSKF